MKIPLRNSESKKQDELLSSFLGESQPKVKEYIKEKSVEEISQSTKNLLIGAPLLDEKALEFLEKMKYFNCPICGEKSKVDECFIEKVHVKTVGTGRSWRQGKSLIVETVEFYSNVRICKKCHKNKKILNYTLAFLCLVPISIICTIEYFSNNTIADIWDVFLYLLCLLLTLLMAYFVKALLYTLITKLFFHIDLDVARKNNAVDGVF